MNNKFFKKLKKPYLIAEIGVNHGCSLKRAKSMILLAKKGGADAVKFQAYKAENLASKYSPAYWDKKKEKTKSQYLLFKKYDKFGFRDYKILHNFCKKKGINFLSTPFDEDSVNYLKKLVPFFKIASADINNYPLLKSVAKTYKPVLISTGASKISEIKKAVKILKKFGARDIAIMHCILNYPTKDINANLSMIKNLKKIFPKNIIGYSDHTLPDSYMSSLLFAYMMGAEIFEKHFTDNKKLSGNDHYHSMNYEDILLFKKNIENLKIKLGKFNKKPIKSEIRSIKFARRSIYSKVEIRKGEKIKAEQIICKRPGIGISPMFWDNVLGKISKTNIPEDKPIKWKFLK